MSSVEETEAAAPTPVEATTAATDAAPGSVSYKDALVDGVPESAKDKAADDGKKDGEQNLKKHLLISGAVIAVIGAIFAIVKKSKDA